MIADAADGAARRAEEGRGGDARGRGMCARACHALRRAHEKGGGGGRGGGSNRKCAVARAREEGGSCLETSTMVRIGDSLTAIA